MFTTCVTIAAVVIWVVGWWKIFSRAGYPGLASVAMLIPVANIVAFLWLAFSPWPVQEQLEEELAAKQAGTQIH